MGDVIVVELAPNINCALLVIMLAVAADELLSNMLLEVIVNCALLATKLVYVELLFIKVSELDPNKRLKFAPNMLIEFVLEPPKYISCDKIRFALLVMTLN